MPAPPRAPVLAGRAGRARRYGVPGRLDAAVGTGRAVRVGPARPKVTLAVRHSPAVRQHGRRRTAGSVLRGRPAAAVPALPTSHHAGVPARGAVPTGGRD